MPQHSSPIALSTASIGNNLLSLAWLLVCVVVIIVLAYLFTKYVAGRGGSLLGAGGGTDRFKVLCRLSLGREQSAVLVQAGERYLLLGVAPSGVTMLAELKREEAEALYARPSDQPAPPSFGEALRSVLKQRKPR
ncbi:MAG: flagellar biosynthetic protein FliO [Clostridiales bacterium]|nr:flagellar biosynthetic protein FliO [Clostridiales bacterium]